MSDQEAARKRLAEAERVLNLAQLEYVAALEEANLAGLTFADLVGPWTLNSEPDEVRYPAWTERDPITGEIP